MGRFMMNIAYIGKGYKGLQPQKDETVKTILGTMGKAMCLLDPANEIKLVSSSRTDKGVNAFSNPVHTDLVHKDPGKSFDPDEITSTTNKQLILEQENIRVLRTLRVSDDFHSRFQALSRTYVYRLSLSNSTKQDWSTPFNPFEYLRTYAVYKRKTDLDLVHKAAEMLSGTHNFTGFTNYNKSLRWEPWINPVKTLEVSVLPGQQFLGHHWPDFYRDMHDQVEFVFKGNSFLYKQIRKMTAVMLAVGQGVIDLDVVQQLLTNPRKTTVKDLSIYCVPSYALYLKEVEYDPQDLKFVAMDTGLAEEKQNTIIQDMQTQEGRSSTFTKVMIPLEKIYDNPVPER